MLRNIAPALKSAAKAVLPRAVIDELKLPFIHRLILDRTRGSVGAGPFAGMLYPARSVGSMFHPKILGTYERQLAPHFEPLLRGSYATFVDIGAAEGYYAVGAAWRNPALKVVAYEQDPAGRTLLAEAAAGNRVQHRVQVNGACSPAVLESALRAAAPPVFVLVDVEGYETTLLDPALVPGLLNATILVELHPALAPGVGPLLHERFGPTHDLTVIADAPRTREDFPWPIPFRWLWPVALRSMDERRACADQQWWLLRPRPPEPC